MTGHCLNCANPVNSNFCENCGQRTSTHRFSIKNIASHDFIHGVFHLDKGFLFTVKELLVRPGHSIREYIEGKRVRHFNYFTLIFLILTVDVLLRQLSPVGVGDIYEDLTDSKTVASYVDKALKEYAKFFALLTIPVYSAFSAFFFRKAKQNFAEHLVLNAYKVAGEFLLSLCMTLIVVFVDDIETLKIITSIFSLLFLAYSIIFYYQYFSAFNYSRKWLFFRSLMATLTLYLILTLVSTIFLYQNN